MPLKILVKLPLLSAALILLTAPLQAQLSGTDNFNDNSKDTAKWGADGVSGNATLLEANTRLEYRVTTPDGDFDEALRPWVLNTARNTDAFDVIVDVFNNVSPTGANSASIGLVVTSLQNAEDSISLELYRGGPSSDGKGFLAILRSAAAGGEVLPYTAPTLHPAVTTASVRLSYNPSTQIFTAYYDATGSADGFQWEPYGTFGVGASGGGNARNSPWQLSQNLGFKVGVGANSEGQVVAGGAVYADNFSVTTSTVSAPTVTSISPTTGSTAGGTSVTITGTNLTGATGVTIGGVAATGMTVINATSITCVTPAGTAGAKSVVVTTPGGSNSANSLFTYVTPAPTVTAISPNTGTTAGGTSVTITGTNLTGATGVTIGGTAATGMTVVNATTITATTPAGTAGAKSVLVTTPGGSNSANSLFTYVAAPTVTAIAPNTGTTAGGTSVTITGTNLSGATGVTFGGVAATSLSANTATSITCVTPAGTAGAKSVVVTTPGGSNIANSLFTYAPAPTVTSSTANLAANASTMTIAGTNFSTTPGNNTVAFTPTGTGTVTASTATSLTVTSLTGLTLGALNAVVTTNGLSSGAPVQVATVVATVPGDVDSLNADLNGTYVLATAVQPDGKMIIAGAFGSVFGVTRQNIARLNPDGTLDTGFNPGQVGPGGVSSVAVQADGRILLAGAFTSVGATARSYIARVHADGTLDASFAPDVYRDSGGAVNSVVVQANGQILLGGQFTSVNGTSRNNIARLNADGTLDPGFNPDTDYQVLTLAVQADGQILFGGGFTTVGGTARNRIARVAANGTLDAGFNPNPGSQVRSVAVQADGRILLGGDFTTVSGITRNHIARVHSDGTLDAGFDPNFNQLGNAESIAVQTDGRILLGGQFTTVGGTTRTIVRLNANGTLDPGFDPNAGYAGAGVLSVAIQADGKILLGGGFSSLQPNGATNATPREKFARLLNDPATQTLSAPDTTQVSWTRGGSSPEVSQVTFEQSTNGGSTWAVLGNGTRTGSTANWQLTGLSLPASVQVRARGRTTGGYYNGSSGLVEAVGSFSGLVTPPLTVTSITPASGSTLGGTSVTISGTGLTGATAVIIGDNVATNMVVLNATTITATIPAHAAGTVSVVVTKTGGTNVGGAFYTYVTPVAGDLDPLNLALNGPYVVTTVVQPDGKVILGGSFTSVLGVSRSNIARLNADGTLDMGFDPAANDRVMSVVVQADGRILLSGYFTTLRPNGAGGSTARQHMARLYADGSLDTSFDPQAGDDVDGMVLQADGKIVIWGPFTSLRPFGVGIATTRRHAARLNANGTVDVTFDPNPNANVFAMAVQPDGKILIGGIFSTLQPNGAPTATARIRLARLHPDGTLDTGFNPRPNGLVASLVTQADGKILVGGSFTALQPNAAPSPTTRNNLARLNADGTMDTAFDPSPDSWVNSTALQADGRILIGGLFWTLRPNGALGTTPRSRIARLNADGTLDPGFDPRTNGDVNTITIEAGGSLLIGGGFTTLQPNGAIYPTTRNQFARIVNDPATQSLGIVGTTQVVWTRGGTSPDLSLVTFELSTNGGSTWTPLGSGTRSGTTASWQLTGLSLPVGGHLRACGRSSGGFANGSSGLVEAVAAFGLLAPSVASITPTSGSTAGGTSVTITGTNLSGATGVTIGGTAATGITVVNATTITATTPAGTAGAKSVVVTTPGGTNSANSLFTYVAAPTVTSISPVNHPLTGDTFMQIFGTNFSGATSVTIGGTAATSVSVVNSTSITCVTPAGTAGSKSVVVTTPGGSNSANSLFTYVAAPTVASIAPPGGPTAGGTIVIITGTNFTGVFGVTIGGAAATSIVVSNATTINAIAPAGTAGTASVVVTTPGGSNSANSLFTYMAAPTVTAIAPNTGTTAGGTSVTITGTNFTGATGLTIGGTAATAMTVVNATTITATTPASTAGARSVVVTTPGGTNSANSLFTYVAAAATYPLSGSDNFNDNFKDTARWGTDEVSGNATFLETSARLEYRVTAPGGGLDEALRPWVLNAARSTDAFDVIVDVFNNVSPTGANSASIGLVLTSLQNAEDSISIELFRGGPSSDGKGFLAVMSSAAAGGEVLPYTAPTAHASVTTASVRLNYNPSTQVFTAYYDTTGSADGFQWVSYGTFGVGASGGGSTRNSPWQMSQNLGFTVAIGASSEGQTVAGGAVYADNFQAVPYPTVTLTPVSELTTTTARLNGTVNPNGLATMVQFDYGLTTSYGSGVSIAIFPNDGTTARNVSAALSGLLPGTLYHYRLSATNSGGTAVTTDGSFTTLTASQAANNAIAAAGLSGPNAALDATPHHDGVENLLKYAFNMNLSGPDSATMPAGGGSGLPGISSQPNGAASIFHFEFVRRIGSGLIYTPQKSNDLTLLNSWVPLADTPTVVPLDATWERVIYEEPYNAATTPRCFGRIQVVLPP